MITRTIRTATLTMLLATIAVAANLAWAVAQATTCSGTPQGNDTTAATLVSSRHTINHRAQTLVAAPLSFHRVAIDAQPPDSPYVKLAGDFNGDGRRDIAIGGAKGPLVWYVNPDWRKVTIAEGGWQTVGGAVGDVDGDGDSDIVPGAQVWFENPLPKGDPAKDPWPAHRISDIRSHDAMLADLDRDGRLDLVARDQSGFNHNLGNTIHVWRQAMPDGWEHHTLECPHGEGLALSDLDGDGDMDVLIGGCWFENPGRIVAEWPKHVYTTRWTWADAKVAEGDLNGDGRADIVLAPAEYKGQTNQIAWYEAPNDPRQPEWQEHVVVPSVESVIHALQVADMDGDGQLDIVAAHMHQGAPPQEVAVFVNQGQGARWAKHVVATTGSHDILTVDFNGDDRPDILGANHSGTYQPVELWLNQTATSIARGPLRVHPTNPRYFTDDGQRAVYLTGSHTWDNLQDMGEMDPPPAFDFHAYLEFLSKYDHNFMRLWRWELVSWDTGANNVKTAKRLLAAPHPWARSGPGQALDGKSKFNLDSFNEDYFQRLRSRVAAARDQGIYVSVMLFEGWGLQHVTDAWQAHPFHPDNNINGLNGDADGDGRGLEVDTLRVPAVTKVQEAYVRKVLDTVNDLDNVLYEIVNESGTYSTEWQEHFIRFIHDYEKGKPKQHPVGMTFQWSRDSKERGSNTNLFQSTADWISPNPDAGEFNYQTNPPSAEGRKVILTDTDHLWGIGGNAAWVWLSFLRGLNPLFMDPYEQGVLQEGSGAQWDPVRRALGVTRRLADRVDLVAMTPRGELASSGYCLAHPAKDYLVFLPAGSEVTVDLSAATGQFQVEWIHPVEGIVTPAEATSGGAKRTLKAPFPGEAVVHLWESVIR